MEYMDEELAFSEKCIAKRRLMEVQGGGEVRRLHIVYFLSQNGRIEHPHLIRVHHLSRNGVHLRDVKRWLSELRGKDMVELFAWSYKRRYKTGYVWQDLVDDDLITPISDNEYILKGSEISSTFNNDLCSYGEKEVPTQKESPLDEVEAKDHKHLSRDAIQEHLESLMDVSIKTSSEIEEESTPFGSETSNLTDYSMNPLKKKHSNGTKDKQEEQKDQKENFEESPFYPCFLSKNQNKKNGNKFDASRPASSTSSTSNSSFTKRRRNSIRPSKMFGNLITCGGVDTNDSVIVTINKRSNTSSSISMNNLNRNTKDELRKGENMGGSKKIPGNSWRKKVGSFLGLFIPPQITATTQNL